MDPQYEIRPTDTTPGVTGHRIVVGVDGSAQNRGAIDWATAEAVRRGAGLMLVAAHEEYVRPVTMFSAGTDLAAYDTHSVTMVRRLVDELRADRPTLDVVGYARPATALGLLLDAAEGATEVVVGKRGMRAFARLLVGSTSIGVAGRSPVPTVVVPDGWDPAEHAAEPIVVGVEIDSDDQNALAFAFERAAALGVGLVAVSAWEVHPALAISPEDRASWDDDVAQGLVTRLDGWRDKYPDVPVETVVMHAHPAMAILELAERTQMIVLGRHTGPRRMGGFSFGSVARAVLHYSTRPVGVVPELPVSGDVED